jgi:RNA polymerase sigma-70 factor (ECF subfamily)
VKSDWTNGPPKPSDWQRWLSEHAPKFLLFARQQTRCEADAQDVLQESVVECWQRQEDGAPPPLPLVFATIRRRAVDLARSSERRVRRELDSEPPDDCWFDTSPEERERSLLIQSAMNQLPNIYREVIILKVWGGLTFAEIAEALGIPANTAASRYRYGLEELRKLTKEVLT